MAELSQGPDTLREVLVKRKTREAVDIALFELVDPAGMDLPAFSAGSHIDVHLPNGLVRQYSLCGDPTDQSRYEICVLRESRSRGGSQSLHDLVEDGTSLLIGSPRNLFPLAVGARRQVLIAGGIGITPLLSMAKVLKRQGSEFDLCYVTRSRERTAFLEMLSKPPFKEHVSFKFTSEDVGGRPNLEALVGGAEPEKHVYVCGPQGFINAVIAAARRTGWRDELIHAEYFGSSSSQAEAGQAFDVQIASTGCVYRIPASTSVTAALAAHGIDIPVSCEQGICGTCLTRVLEGVPEHRDQYLTPAERARNDQFTPCCSRAKCSRLVLDL